MNWGKKWFVDFSAEKTQLVLFDRSNNTGSIEVNLDGSVLEEKPSFKMLGLTVSSKLGWGSYIISTTCPCMEYCHSWVGVPNCFLGLLGKLQKRICGTVGPSLSASLEPLAQC